MMQQTWENQQGQESSSSCASKAGAPRFRLVMQDMFEAEVPIAAVPAGHPRRAVCLIMACHQSYAPAHLQDAAGSGQPCRRSAQGKACWQQCAHTAGSHWSLHPCRWHGQQAAQPACRLSAGQQAALSQQAVYFDKQEGRQPCQPGGWWGTGGWAPGWIRRRRSVSGFGG